MCASAAASSSPVVSPGRARSRTISRVRATTRPACRMCSTCSGVLTWTPRSRQPTRSGLGDDVERGEDALGDLVDAAHAVDLDEDAAGAVELDERLGLVGVDLLALADHLFGVVGATLGLRPLQQAG